jgi:hypothetical protein
MMQSILVSWLRMRQHLPVIPLKLDGSTAVQDEQITWPQERQAPDLERTEGHQEWLMCPEKCEHQIFLHCLAQASQIWLFSSNNTSRLLECELLPKSRSMLIHSCSKAIQINSDVHMTWFLCEDPIRSKEVEMGLQAFTRVCTIHFWFPFTNLTSCYCCVFPLTVTFSTYFQALWKLGLQFRVNCKMSRA